MGEKVGVVNRGVEAAVGFGAGVAVAINRGLGVTDGLAGEVAETEGLGVDAGDAIEIGVAVGVGTGISDNVSKGLGIGVAISNGSGVEISSGRIVALGFATALAVGLGLGVGAGVSSVAAGLFWRKGVEAASCARTRAAVTKNTVARTIKRMVVIRVFLGRITSPTLARARRHGQAE